MQKPGDDKIQLSILLPVKPPVKKYLQNNVFLKRPYQVTSVDPVGIILLNLLKPVPKYYKPRHADETHPGYISIIVGPHYATRGKLYLDAQAEYTFNAYIEGFIKLELFQYLESLVSYRDKIRTLTNDVLARYGERRKRKLANVFLARHGIKKTRTLINDFLSKYNITDDEMSIQALEKAYYRWKKKVQYLEDQGL